MAQYRKESLERDHYYHIFSRSIAKFVVFNSQKDCSRFLEILKLYRYEDFTHKYSKFIQLEASAQFDIEANLKRTSSVFVEIVAYCLMPTHFHLILKQTAENGISKYIAKVLNCYSRYFNIRHRRTGPLWSGRFKSVLVSDDRQLLHLSRYIHLNPTSVNLVNKPEKWTHSSYLEYIEPEEERTKLCNFQGLFDLSPSSYKKFVMDQKDYQKRLSLIKNLLIDDYTG